jgi:predicted nucleic acid-binding protein
MPPKLPVVINTGPLIALAAALGDLEALAQVAVMVVVPGEVFTECAVGAHHDDTADKVRAAICCHIRPVFSELPPSLWDLLDIGEAAVIHTALTEGITTVAIDELKGRWGAPEVSCPDADEEIPFVFPMCYSHVPETSGFRGRRKSPLSPSQGQNQCPFPP